MDPCLKTVGTIPLRWKLFTWKYSGKEVQRIGHARLGALYLGTKDERPPRAHGCNHDNHSSSHPPPLNRPSLDATVVLPPPLRHLPRSPTALFSGQACQLPADVRAWPGPA